MSQSTILTTIEELAEARKRCWEEYLASMHSNTKELEEYSARRLTFGDAVMRFFLTKKGKPGPDGYPVYIALHGGGGCPAPELNDSQWRHQQTYYFDSVSDGICVAPRGIRDTWNTHFNEESYPLYDRLIADLIAYEQADPNRIYLLGFSAGGDGVYGITPYMPDRFAAANMSAGHPNSQDLTNLYRLPIELQVGENDLAYDRNRMTARYGVYLDRLAAKYGGGFEHRVLIHSGKPHNFRDNEPSRIPQTVLADYRAWLRDGCEDTVAVNSNAIDYVNCYSRNPLPGRLVWNLGVRASFREVRSFYWLQAKASAAAGHVIASYNSEENSVTVEELTANGSVSILISEEMLDVFAPITIHYPDHTETVTVAPSLENIRQSTAERGDPAYQFCACVPLNM